MSHFFLRIYLVPNKNAHLSGTMWITMLLFMHLSFCTLAQLPGRAPCRGVDSCPICTDPATYPDDVIDQTVKCKTEPVSQHQAEMDRCREGQAISARTYSEPMISDRKMKQYYRVCDVIKECSSESFTRCRSQLSLDKSAIPPLDFPAGFQSVTRTIHKSIRSEGTKHESDTVYYYRLYKPRVVTGKANPNAESRKGLRSCDIARSDEPCVSNCVGIKTPSLPKSCEDYVVDSPKGKGKLIRLDVSGNMLDEKEKCVYYQCSPAQSASASGIANVVLLSMSIASLILCYSCCFCVTGAACGYWIGNKQIKS
eukprot:816925_1